MNLIDVTINGHRYTNDPNLAASAGIPTDYQFIGYNAIPALANFADDVQAVGSAAVNQATDAKATAELAAQQALLSPTTGSVSGSSIAVGLGAKTFVMEAGKDFRKTMYVTVANRTAPDTIFMNGPLTSYNPATGEAGMVATRALGSGSSADWVITLSSPAQPATGGAAVATGSLAITATSLRYQEITPTNYGLSFSLTGANTAIQGPAAFTLRNHSLVYPWDVQVNVSGVKGFVRPNKTAYVDVVGTSYRVRDLSGYGSAFFSQVTFSGIVAGTAGLWTKAVLVQSGGTVVLVHGAALHAVFISAAGDVGQPLLIRTGLSTTGKDSTVAAVAVGDGTDNVLVASVPDSGTALQTVVVTVSQYGVLGLGTVVPTTVASSTAGIVDLRAIIDASGSLIFILGLISAAATTLSTYGINVTTPGAAAHTVSTPRTETTVGSFAALLTDLNNANVYMTVTLTAATTLAIKAFSLNSLGAQTPGGTQSATITSGSNVQVRAQMANNGTPFEFGYWAVGYIVSNVARVAKLTLSGSAPALSAGAAVNSAITTVTLTSLQLGTDLSGYEVQGTAVSGTDAAGRFLCEMMDFSMSGATPSASSSTLIAMAAAISPVWIGQGANLSNSGGPYVSLWQLSTTTEVMMAMTVGASYNAPVAVRLLNAGGYATLLQAPDYLTPKTSRNRNTLRSANRCIAIGDGSKPSMEYVFESTYGEPTARPVAPVAAMSFGSFGGEAFNESTWLAAGLAPMTNLQIQNFKVA